MCYHETLAIYKLSELVAKNKMPSFSFFKNKIVFLAIKYWMTHENLYKLYAFIEVMQNHPKRNELAFALRGVFSMVLFDMISDSRYYFNIVVEYPILFNKYAKGKKSVLDCRRMKKKIRW